MENTRMKLSWLLVAVASVCSMCKKDDAQNGGAMPVVPSVNCRVIQFDRQNSPTHFYEYDGQKRVIRHQFADYVNTISYALNVIENVQTNQGNPFVKYIITLNSDGFATNVKSEYPNNTWANDAFEYDGPRAIKKTHTTSSSITQKHTLYQWLDGNMIAETAPDGKITSYTFDTNEAFQYGDYHGFMELERSYKTVRNKNRVKSVKLPSGAVYSISYAEDDKGLVKSYNVTSGSSVNYTVSPKYNCN